jgi:hypothetical protein
MLVCGICKQEKPRRNGHLFFACSDLLHTRLFICSECLGNVALQRSLHEFCYECVEHIVSKPEYTDLSKAPVPTRFDDLVTAIGAFEKAHASLFEELPGATDLDCVHPGSTHPDVKKWRERFRT